MSRLLGVTAATLTAWRDSFLAAGEAALTSWPTDGETLESEQLKARLGEMLLKHELLEQKITNLEGGRPLAPQEVEAMSRTISPSSGKPYRLALVCRVWRAPRATLYRHQAGAADGTAAAPRPARADAGCGIARGNPGRPRREPISW